MWDPPRAGIEPVPHVLAGKFLTAGPQGKSQLDISFPSQDVWWDWEPGVGIKRARPWWWLQKGHRSQARCQHLCGPFTIISRADRDPRNGCIKSGPVFKHSTPVRVLLTFHILVWMFSPLSLKVDLLLLASSMFVKRPAGINTRPV